MEGGSPENGFDEISYLLKDNESTPPEDLDLRFIMSKDNSKDYVYDDSPGNDKFNFHLGEQGESALPSLSSNLGCHDISGSDTERFHSSAQNRGHSDGLLDPNVVGDQNLEHLRGQFHQDPHRLCGGYLGDSSFDIDVESVDDEISENVCIQPRGFISVENHGLKGEIIDRECTIPHTAVGEKSFLEVFEQELNKVELAYNVEQHGLLVDHIQKLHSPSLHLDDPKSLSENGNGSRNSPYASKDVDSAHVDQQDRGKTSQVSVSPLTSGEISVSPDTSPYTYHLSGDQGLYASSGHSDDTSYSKTAPDGIYGQSDCRDQYVDTPSMDHSLHTGVQNSASSQGSGLRSQYMEGSSGKSDDTTGNHHRNRSGPLSPRKRNCSSRSKRYCYTNREARSPRRRSSGKVSCFQLSPESQNISDSHGNKEFSYTSRSHKRKHRLGGNSDRGREVTCKDHLLDYGCQKYSCQHEPQERFPRDHHSHHNHRRMGRSISPSPVRRRHLDSGYKRKCNKSRSRSPYGRKRMRYSPRLLSPPRRYFAYDRSHQFRCLSPASYRRTGIGKPGTCLFVAGFGFLTTERELERKFSRYGRVRNVRIIRDKRSGISRGYGFLTLERDEEADAAIRAVHKTEWNGRVVLVEKSISN